MSTPVVVEFMGPPGAGKTTVAHGVIEELERQGLRCFGHSKASEPESIEKKSGGMLSKTMTLGRFAGVCVRHRRLALAALRFARGVEARGLAGFRRLFVLLSRFGHLKRAMSEGYDVLVLDQGPLQNIWSIGTTGDLRPGDRDLVPLVRHVVEDLAPIFVLVELDPDLAVERIANRRTMRSRFDRMPPSSAREALARHDELFVRLFETAVGVGHRGGLRIDGSRPIAQNVDRVLPVISRARQNHAR